MRVALHPCYILHQRPFRESSLILEVFSLLHGRISLVARGARKGTRGKSAPLQPLRRLNLAWSGRAELCTLTGSEPDGVPPVLHGSRLLSAFYLNELLLRLLHRHEPHASLFHAYEAGLLQLGEAREEERVLRTFEKHLLEALGYGLVLDRETASGRPIEAEGEYYYHFDHGPDSSKLSSLDAVRVSGKTLLALHAGDRWDEVIAREAKSLFRPVIDRQLDNKPLHSRELYKAYLKNRAAL